MPQRDCARILTAVSVIVILALTLTPQPNESSTTDACIWCGSYAGLDIALNILLFMPLGASLILGGAGAERALSIPFVLSFCIEAAQLWIPGRDTSLRDLLSNTAGGALGAALAGSWRSWLLPPLLSARRLTAAWMIAWVAGLSLAHWMLSPSLLPSTYWGQWAPRLGQFAPFEGEVRDATVLEAPLPRGRFFDSPQLRARMTRDGIMLAATVRATKPTPRLASIVSIFDGDRNEIAVLGQEGRDLAFRTRLGAADLRLRAIAVRLADAFPPERDSVEVRVVGGLVRGELWTRVTHDGTQREARMLLDPALGWLPLFDSDAPLHPPVVRLVSLLWIAVLAIPFGWWGAAGRLPAAGMLLVGLAAAVAPLAVQRLAGQRAMALDAIAIVAGIVAGHIAWRVTARHALRP